MRQAFSLSMNGGGQPPTTASAFAHCSSLTSSNFSRNSNSNPEPTASVATGTSRAGKFGQRMRIAITSPSFYVVNQSAIAPASFPDASDGPESADSAESGASRAEAGLGWGGRNRGQAGVAETYS